MSENTATATATESRSETKARPPKFDAKKVGGSVVLVMNGTMANLLVDILDEVCDSEEGKLSEVEFALKRKLLQAINFKPLRTPNDPNPAKFSLLRMEGALVLSSNVPMGKVLLKLINGYNDADLDPTEYALKQQLIAYTEDRDNTENRDNTKKRVVKPVTQPA